MSSKTGFETVAVIGRKDQAIEVFVFLFLIVPSMIFSFLAVKRGVLDFTTTAYATIMRDLALVCLILYFLRRNQEPVKEIGWTGKGWQKEIILGFLLYIPLLLSLPFIEEILRRFGFTAPSTPMPAFLTAGSAGQMALAFILVVVVAVAEETVFRGYLILRFRALTRDSRTAAFLSAVVFSLGHGYEGSAGVVTVGIMGFILALIYLWRKSLIAPVIMHFLQDFINIVLLPLLGVTP